MDILYLMILCSVSVAAVFLVLFIIGAKNGQFEDDESPAVRMLMENEIIREDTEKTNVKTAEPSEDAEKKIEN